jgi:ribose 5-phosphate isomerase RpiB
MRIALGNDHAGYSLKAHVRSVLEKLGHEVIDTGTRWTLLAMIEEFARHAGHGDILREQIDKATLLRPNA